MSRNHRKETRTAILLLPLLLIGLPVWLTYRAVRQDRLDYRLIQAIKAEDTPAILASLRAGANGNARDLGRPPGSFRETLIRYVNRLKYGGSKQDPGYHPTALFLMLTPHPSADTQGDVLTSMYWGPERPRENVPVVKSLLEHGADIYARDNEQETPLVRAFEFQWMDTVRLLVEAGASPDIYNDDHQTPLVFADAKCAETLLQHGANVNARSMGGRTPLMYVLCPPTVHADAVPVLLAYGADVNVTDDFGTTPIALASLFADAATMKLLLAHGADANKGGIAGQTPLMGAVLCKDIDKVKLLMEHGAKTTPRDNTGNSALDWAKKVDASGVITLLEQAGG